MINLKKTEKEKQRQTGKISFQIYFHTEPQPYAVKTTCCDTAYDLDMPPGLTRQTKTLLRHSCRRRVRTKYSERESNPHGHRCPQDFKSCVSTYSTIRAIGLRCKDITFLHFHTMLRLSAGSFGIKIPDRTKNLATKYSGSTNKKNRDINKIRLGTTLVG